MKDMTKCELLKKISEYQFVAVELHLYLDTHPCDQEAMAYYRMAKEKYEEEVADYQEKIGPLFHAEVTCGDTFAWVEGPWPWEGGCA